MLDAIVCWNSNEESVYLNLDQVVKVIWDGPELVIYTTTSVAREDVTSDIVRVHSEDAPQVWMTLMGRAVDCQNKGGDTTSADALADERAKRAGV